jgi:H+/Cl- antiporter ClcA
MQAQTAPPAPAPSLRGRDFARLLLVAGVLGVPASLLTLAFVVAFTEGIHLLWETIPDELGVATLPWFGLVVTTTAGAIVGAMIRYAPGHAGPDAAAGHGVGDDEPVRLRTLPGVAATSLVSLTGGASLGPEAPLVTMTGTLGRWVVQQRSLDPRVAQVLVLAAVASVIAGIFGSPLAAAVLALELVPVGGRQMYAVLLPALVSATMGFFVFVAVRGDAFAAYELPAYEGYRALHVVYAVAIGAGGALLGLVFVLAYRALARAVERLGAHEVLLGAAGGATLGLTAIVCGELVLFSGEHELQEVIDGDETVGALLLLVVGKVVATAVCMATGFRGGRVFPALFAGGVAGLALAEIVSSVPAAVGVACGMTAAGIAVIRLPIFIVLLVGFFTSPELVPLLVISAVTAYVIVYDKPEFADHAPEPGREAGSRVAS